MTTEADEHGEAGEVGDSSMLVGVEGGGSVEEVQTMLLVQTPGYSE